MLAFGVQVCPWFYAASQHGFGEFEDGEVIQVSTEVKVAHLPLMVFLLSVYHGSLLNHLLTPSATGFQVCLVFLIYFRQMFMHKGFGYLCRISAGCIIQKPQNDKNKLQKQMRQDGRHMSSAFFNPVLSSPLFCDARNSGETSKIFCF